MCFGSKASKSKRSCLRDWLERAKIPGFHYRAQMLEHAKRVVFFNNFNYFSYSEEEDGSRRVRLEEDLEESDRRDSVPAK